jgi:hypothetical protein
MDFLHGQKVFIITFIVVYKGAKDRMGVQRVRGRVRGRKGD